MKRPRRPRLLSPEERALWASIINKVQPLAGRPPVENHETDEPMVPPAPPQPQPAIDRAALRPAAPPVKPLIPLERRMLLQVKRGKMRLQGTLDLHGLYQDEAHAALIQFLRHAHQARKGWVLIITGKGSGGFDERGVLRRMVPHWLHLPDLRPLVLGFEEAAPHHGGAGALYVRLRRS
jgi:DNA-nicking Smr family endonuclease